MDHLEHQRSILQSALGRTPNCPQIDVLAAAEKNSEVRRHLDSCARCQAEVALLHQFESSQPDPEEAESLRWIEAQLAQRTVTANSVPANTRIAARPSRKFGAWRLLGWTASVAIVIAVFVYQRPLDPVHPSDGQSPVWRSTQFAVVGPTGDLVAAPSSLSWESVPNAATYRVRVMEIDGTVIWSASISGTTAELPRKVVSVMVPGRTLLWDVSAWNAAVEKIGATDLQTIHILPTGR
jgi:anti-sigma factor RsiW